MRANVELIVAADWTTREAVYRFREHLAARVVNAVDLLPSPYRSGDGAIGLQDLLDPFAIVAAAVDVTTASIVAAARTNFLRDGGVPFYPELYGLGELSAQAWMTSSVTTCWTLAPPLEYASTLELTHPAMRLAWTLYDVALHERICHDFLDCPDAHRPFFERLGYRRVRAVEHPARGVTNLMRLDIYDWSYLASINSPYLSLARGVA